MASSETSSMTASSGTNGNVADIIHVSAPWILLVMIPLFGIAGISWNMGLDLERPIVIGVFRSAVQLTLCGYILLPIFTHPSIPLVSIYVSLMVMLASYEASRRTKYFFEGQYATILLCFACNIAWVSVLAFGIVIRPKPMYDPHYIIPIIGMLLGNCVNGVSLSLTHAVTGLVERQTELEVLLAFGATCQEATADIVREAVRIGTVPIFNSMAVIGIVSIPGMMTGQILGGSSVVDAARYQILIFYFIAMCCFGTILMGVCWVQSVVCDSALDQIDTNKLQLRATGASDWSTAAVGDKIKSFWNPSSAAGDVDVCAFEKNDLLMATSTDYGAFEEMPNQIRLEVLQRSAAVTDDIPTVLSFQSLSRTIAESHATRKTLFRNVSEEIHENEILLLRGPSAVGKSQLLRLLSGLVTEKKKEYVDHHPMVSMQGRSQTDNSFAHWRVDCRYICQSKVDILGSPHDFIRRIVALKNWQNRRTAPSYTEMVATTTELVTAWGMDSSTCLNKDWRQLSGGEAQRVYLAIAVSSKPVVLMLDEVTSSLDHASKLKVESSLLNDISGRYGVRAMVWVTHDEDQIERIKAAM